MLLPHQQGKAGSFTVSVTMINFLFTDIFAFIYLSHKWLILHSCYSHFNTKQCSDSIIGDKKKEWMQQEGWVVPVKVHISYTLCIP